MFRQGFFLAPLDRGMILGPNCSLDYRQLLLSIEALGVPFNLPLGSDQKACSQICRRARA
jgi:hypothetical protein